MCVSFLYTHQKKMLITKSHFWTSNGKTEKIKNPCRNNNHTPFLSIGVSPSVSILLCGFVSLRLLWTICAFSLSGDVAKVAPKFPDLFPFIFERFSVVRSQVLHSLIKEHFIPKNMPKILSILIIIYLYF